MPFIKLKTCSGFCLMELLVVMVIISSLGLVSLNKWKGIKHRIELEHETLSLFAYIQQVQSEAIWGNKTVKVQLIEKENGKYFRTKEKKIDAACRQIKTHYKIGYSTHISMQFMHKASFTFYGKHNTTEPGTIVLRIHGRCTHIVISNRGRLRYCSKKGMLLRIPAC